jgi:hypothetical protein
MTDKIDQLFKVPNNEEGAFFISLLRKYATDGVYVRVRGRKPNHKKAEKLGILVSHQSIPKEIADELGIYLQYDNKYGNRHNLGIASMEYGRNSAEKYYTLYRQHGELINNLKELGYDDAQI